MALYIGTNYHPHDWEPERWKIDIELMKKAGFDTVRLGHLCWDSYEPENGVYTFEWFDQVMDLFADNGIGVVLDVSMHPAPAWVHKECAGCRIGSKGKQIQASLTRYMEDVSDADYQYYALRFAEKLTDRYRNHPALFAFGLCNELGAGFPSYSEESRKRFVEWLKKKYQNVDALNRAWCTRRWSRRVSSFEEVELQENELAVGAPEAWLDMRRFFSDGVGEFLTALKNTVEKTAPGIPHASNHYAEFSNLGFDYLKYYPEFVDYPGIGFYPGYQSREEIPFYVTAAWYMARLAETHKPMWCLEFVTGGVGIQNSCFGINRMYVFWCLLHRAQMVLGWTFRSMLNGEEQFLYGMLDHDGTPNDNYREYAQIASDFRKLERYGFPYLPQPEIGVADSFDSKMVAAYHPRQFRMKQEYQLAVTVKALEKKNLDYNIVDLRNLREKYRILLIPSCILMGEASADAIRIFVEAGGTAVMTGYSAMVNENGQVFDVPRPGRLTDVFGINIRGFCRTSGMELTAEEERRRKRNPQNGHEMLEVVKGKESFLLDVDYYEKIQLTSAEIYAEEKTYHICAVSRNRFGKGTAYYVFSEANESILGWLVGKILEEEGCAFEQTVPEGICFRQIAEGQTFYLNMTGDKKIIGLKKCGRGVLSGKEYKDKLMLDPFDGELIVDG